MNRWTPEYAHNINESDLRIFSRVRRWMPRQRLTRTDLVSGLILGLVCTALAYTMWTEGTSRIRVQHSSILGYLEPVTAPIYALLLLGQAISGWTIAGGALIVLAGILILVWGEREAPVPEPPV